MRKSASYTLPAVDEGKAAKARVSFTDDGVNAFTFELRFSEKFRLSYKTLRDHAFEVTGGRVVGARQMDSDTPNIHWEITVRPDRDGEVVITLPVTADCADDGAICTEDGRMLSNELALTVSGAGR